MVSNNVASFRFMYSYIESIKPHPPPTANHFSPHEMPYTFPALMLARRSFHLARVIHLKSSCAFVHSLKLFNAVYLKIAI